MSGARAPILVLAGGLLLAASACGGAGTASMTASAQAPRPHATSGAALKTDSIVLRAGGEIAGRVIAENDAFYVFEPNERRKALEIVERSKVRSVKWADGKAPSGLTSYDQIVLASGHVLNGRITEHNKRFGWYWIQSWHGDFGYRVYEAQVARIFRGGKEVPLRR